MRELKFRFWGPFGEWGADNEYEREFVMLSGDEFAWEDYTPINALFNWTQKRDVVIMQYTGLKDKNGQEIYEGDIVRPVQINATITDGLVEWSEASAMFGIRQIGAERIF